MYENKSKSNKRKCFSIYFMINLAVALKTFRRSLIDDSSAYGTNQ